MVSGEDETRASSNGDQRATCLPRVYSKGQRELLEVSLDPDDEMYDADEVSCEVREALRRH